MQRIAIFGVIITFVIGLSPPSYPQAQLEDMKVGFSRDYGGGDKSLFGRFIRELNRYPSQLLLTEDENIYFAFSGQTVGKYRVLSEQIEWLGGWSLKSAKSCSDAPDSICVEPWHTGRWGSEEFLDPLLIERISEALLASKLGFSIPGESMRAQYPGCFSLNPLRSGDVTLDGNKELVIFTGDSIVIFSTVLNKTIFSYFFMLDDAELFSEQLEGGLIAQPGLPTNPQYGSRLLFVQGQGTASGLRSLGKIYLSKFSGGETNDIILWRKLYKSKLENDATRGFDKLSDHYVHYKLVNGTYKSQETDASVIEGWLASNELTWQKGFPSKSECPGQEDQLIPEMHDTLLNDPEVLQ